MPIADSGTVRFGAFEADLRSGELRKDGVKLKLEGQPFQVLAALLARPGQLVTRDELRKELWPDETFVDFEQGINAAVKRLRAALQDSAESPKLIETLPRRGYRFIGSIENDDRTEVIAVQENGPAAESLPQISQRAESRIQRAGRSGRWRRVLIGIAGAAAVVVLALGLYIGPSRKGKPDRSAAGKISSIAVLPLQNLTGNAEQEYFVDGMTEALITELGKIRGVRVISRTSAMTFKGARKPLPEIARELSVDAVVEGAVSRNGDRIRITARLIQAAEEQVVWSESYERDLRDISGLQSEIAFVLADQTKSKLVNQEQASRARPVEPRAYEAYLHGRYLQARRNPEDMRKALSYFQHALEIDPQFAPAYVGIVDCYSIGGGRQMGVPIKEADARMKEAAQKVIELDGGSSAAHYASAMVKWHEWDFPGAEKEFQRALELNPGDVQARQHYAHYLITVLRPDDARREIQHALALDPLSAMLTVDVGHTYSYGRKYPEAISEGKKALAMQDGFLYARMMVSWAYWLDGEVQKAVDSGWPIVFQPERSQRAKEIYEHEGERAMLRWLARDAELRNATPDFYSRSSMIALWYAALGDNPKTMLWLEKACQEHDPWLPMDLASPQFDEVRSDPRFEDLLRRAGLPL